MCVKWYGVLEWHRKIRKMRWSSTYIRRPSGENAISVEAYLHLAFLEKCMPSALKKCLEIIEPKLEVTQCRCRSCRRPHFHSPAYFWKMWVSQRRLHMSFGRWESIRPGYLWKALGSVAAVRCWQTPVTGRQVTVFLLKHFSACQGN